MPVITLMLSLLLACVFADGARAQDAFFTENSRLTIGVPAWVGHSKDRPGVEDWNEGWFENEGLFADMSWPVAALGDGTILRLGVTGGAFDNSMNDLSVFGGGMAEIEALATERLSFALGTYAGVITGYETSPAAAIAPYIGSAYQVGEGYELGLRGFWLPAETIAGADLAPSDAWVGAVTVGKRF